MQPVESPPEQYRTDGRGGSHRMAMFHLTSKCNITCDYCYARENAKLDLPVWDAYEAEPMVRALAANGYRVSLGGGEPTFVPERMVPLLELCSQYGIPSGVLTNGRLLDEPMLRVLKDKDCRHVQVSVDHRRDVELLRPAFEIGASMGLPMAAGSVLDARDFQDMFSIYHMLRDTGAAAWRILKRTTFGRHGVGRGNVPEDRWRATMLRLEEHIRDAPPDFQIRYEPGLVPLCWYQSLTEFDRPSECGARINKRLFIYPVGAVYSCGLPRSHAFFVGNYRRDRVRVEDRLRVTPQWAKFNIVDNGHSHCVNTCSGGCLQYRYDSCDSRCQIENGLISICCYEKLPLDVHDPAQEKFLPSRIYADFLNTGEVPA
jgi:radical SAM protein with 4Fe4S-binding SPASM domain